MMKKYISLILAGLLMFTAAGCGSETNAETDTESTGEYVNLQASRGQAVLGRQAL